MHKLLRLYSRNRIKVWTIILAVIFTYIVIQIFNNVAKENNKIAARKISEEETTLENVVSSGNKNKSLVTNSEMTTNNKQKFNEIIEKFLKACVNHKPEEAYDLISQDCKDEFYPTLEFFVDKYYQKLFDGEKNYSYQSWASSGGTYIYRVKILEDMLSTGISDNQYVEDYFSMIKENDDIKLNINNFVGKRKLNGKYEDDNLKIQVVESRVYMDYELYTIKIKNKTENTIILDSREKTNTTFVTDQNNIKFSSLLFENKKNELNIEPGETKKITIKFSDNYRDGITIKNINFTDIKLNSEAEDVTSIKIDL